MALSMFQASVPVITQLLNGLSGVVDKAAAHIAEKKLEESAFLQARLFPDMFTLGGQIRQATDFGRNAPGRLASVDLPPFPDADASEFGRPNSGIYRGGWHITGRLRFDSSTALHGQAARRVDINA